jgi:DNA-binding ferritin-like protein (Dps family)
MTGSDLTREWKAFEARAEALPADCRAAWEQIKVHLFPYAGFTGRKLMPILDGAPGLLEETAADGQSVHDVLGAAFGDDLVKDSRTYADGRLVARAGVPPRRDRSEPRSGLEAVAHAGFGEQVPGSGGVGFELAA